MVKIGIVDTGVNLLHPKLADKNIICKVINDNNAFILTGNSDNVGEKNGFFKEMFDKQKSLYYKGNSND